MNSPPSNIAWADLLESPIPKKEPRKAKYKPLVRKSWVVEIQSTNTHIERPKLQRFGADEQAAREAYKKAVAFAKSTKISYSVALLNVGLLVESFVWIPGDDL